MPIEHVNIHGFAWNPSEASIKPKKKVKREAPEEFHKGWLVEGVPPGAIEEAQAMHLKNTAALRVAGQAVRDFDRENWLMNARAKRLRAKPYEIKDGATACKELAEKAGWLRVRLVEVKKVAEKALAA